MIHNAEEVAAKWAKRDAQRAAEQEYYAQQQRAETERLSAIIADAFRPLPVSLLVADGYTYTKDALAEIAVWALRDAGVVFASIGPCCDRHFDGTVCDPECRDPQSVCTCGPEQSDGNEESV